MKTNVKNRQVGFTLLEFIVGLVVASIMAAMLYNYLGTSFIQSSMPISRMQKILNLSEVMENIIADYNRLNAVNLRYKWMASTNYRFGAIVTPRTVPATPDGGHYYACTVAGTSGSSEPSWPTANGATVTDGSITWVESGNIIWQKSHPYALNDVIVPIVNTGHYYRCTTAGTSGTVAPTSWPTDPGDTVTDNDITWTEADTVLDTTITTDNLMYYLTTTPARYGTDYTVITTQFIQFNGSTEVNAGDSGTSSEKNNLKVTIKNNDSGETQTTIFTIR